MNKRVLAIAVVLVLVAVGAWVYLSRGEAGNGGNSINPDAKFYADRALNVFAALQNGDYDGVTRDFNKRFKATANPETFRSNWPKVLEVCGPLKSYTITHAEDSFESGRSAYRVYVDCQFEKHKLYGIVDFDPQKTICNFSLHDKPRR